MRIYPNQIEQKLEVDQIRDLIKGYCQMPVSGALVMSTLPSVDFGEIRQRLMQTSDYIKITENDAGYPKGNLEDIKPLLIKIKLKGSYLGADDFFLLSKGNRILSQWQQFLSKNKESYSWLAQLAGDFEVDQALSDKIDEVIDERGEVRDSASPALMKIRRDIVKSEQKVRKSIRTIFDQVKKDHFTDESGEITIREGRLVIPVKAEFKRKVAGFVHDESSTGQTVFMEPTQVLELNNMVRELGYQEQREVHRILTQLSDRVRINLNELERGANFLPKLDFIKAKAKFAHQFGACIPILKKTPGMELIKAVHPLLWKVNQEQQKAVVPLDLHLSHQEHRFLIISGPNAGGKSVAMKTVGLLQYMLQCGFPVTVDPASTFGVFDQIFIDIGDSQSLENDLSTYSSRLTAMKYFSEWADRKSLILMDEFGTGTEPQFGGAIAEALLNRLVHQQSYGVITTHYANIKKYADHAKGMINGAMRYDTDHLVPLYELEIGKPGSSFALEIARKIGLNNDLIAYAKSKIGVSQVDYDKMLTDLQGDKAKYEKLNQDLTHKEAQLKQLRKDYLSLKEMLESDKKRIIRESKLEAGRILAGANKEIERVIRDIKESNADKEKTRAGRESITDLKLKMAITSEKRKAHSAAFKVGDQVRIKNHEGIGTLLHVKGKKAQVVFGSLTSFVQLDRLEKISGAAGSKTQKKRRTGGLDLAQRQEHFNRELDVRGKRPEEVLAILDAFMDDAIVLGNANLKIIHGKGHGVLREVIRTHLKTYRNIETMHDEHLDRGGSGITLVTLK